MRGDTVVGVFAERVTAAPETIAVVTAEGRCVSYGDLDERSGALAGALVAAGVTVEEVVGLAAAGLEAMVVGALGILRAGGAYLPIDVAYPGERRDAMMAAAGARIVVADREAAADLSGGTHRVIDADQPGGAGAPRAAVRGESLAYVIFTSGSTGGPRGVAVTHRGVVNLACGQTYCDLGPGTRVGQAASRSFDVATFEIWGPLLNGSTVVDMRKDELLDAERLRSALLDRSVTSLVLTTGLFNQLVEDDPSLFASLRDLMVGGEAADPRRVAQVLTATPPERLLNVYGPTEATAFTSWHLVEAIYRGAPVPIGRGLAGYDLHVLDEQLEAVPDGETGELCIGGTGLARGYITSAAETAARFVPAPGAAAPGARLYRTGDLVRRLPGGDLVFVGRLDTQVKVSGHRIELEEVETAILQATGVAAAAVLVDERDGVKQLVAWVQPGPAAGLDGAGLRGALADVLPAYMVPARVVLVDRLPLSLNGKVDRAALRRGLAPAAIAPSHPDLVDRFAGICREVLGTAVGEDDTLLDLGASSLAAMRIIGRVRKQFGVRLEAGRLLDGTTTVGELSLQVAVRRQAS